MSTISRGIKNALRNPLRSGIIALMLAISIGLVLAMLVARGSIETKINDLKSTTGTTITIRAAGIMGFAGGGNPLTAANIATITGTAHITSTVQTLSDQLSSDDTSLTPSLELGSFGRRQQSSSDSSNSGTSSTTNTSSTGAFPSATLGARTTVTGTTDPNSVSTDGGSLTISSGSTIDGSGDADVALVGSDLATKNNLSAGSTFTAYGKTFTVQGIFTTNDKFNDSGLIVPLATLQNLTSQAGDATTVVATVDNSDNVSSAVTALKNSLGDSADITSELTQAQTSIASLQGIASLALAGVIGAAVAGAVIVLLTTIIVVRERRREIGIMKAIGGSNAKVIGQFMIESLTLTVVGAVLGIVLGILVSGPMTTSLVSGSSNTSTNTSPIGSTRSATRTRGGFSGFAGQAGAAFGGAANQLRANALSVTAVLTPTMFATALGITLLISLVGSAIPAWLIARVRPAEVLRTE